LTATDPNNTEHGRRHVHGARTARCRTRRLPRQRRYC
jgi:hypothetical protein